MKHLLSILLLFSMTVVNAQTILKGDMNNDEQVTITDVTSLVNVILGKAPQEEISVGGDSYKVDNSLVVGTWVAPDNSSFALNEDGTTTFPDAATFKFRPVQGVLTFYDASDNPVRAIVLNEVTTDYLMAVDYATNTFTKYTKRVEETDNHEYVDLGLPSGTLWATCNIGANSPEEYGDYFAWGETDGYNSGKISFSWSNYFDTYSDGNSFNKYFADLGLTELELCDDAAYVNWGPGWRIPSKEQIDELMNNSNTTINWTTQNGVNGNKIKSIRNGNSIFLPAAGYFKDSEINVLDSSGYYWSSTLYSTTAGWTMNFDWRSYWTGCFRARYFGQSIRPVRLSE